MTLVAKHPELGPISQFSNSVYPPDPMPPRSSILAGARATFFGVCSREKDCSTSFPDLAKTFGETLNRLGRTPLMVSVRHRCT